MRCVKRGDDSEAATAKLRRALVDVFGTKACYFTQIWRDLLINCVAAVQVVVSFCGTIFDCINFPGLNFVGYSLVIVDVIDDANHMLVDHFSKLLGVQLEGRYSLSLCFGEKLTLTTTFSGTFQPPLRSGLQGPLEYSMNKLPSLS